MSSLSFGIGPRQQYHSAQRPELNVRVRIFFRRKQSAHFSGKVGAGCRQAKAKESLVIVWESHLHRCGYREREPWQFNINTSVHDTFCADTAHCMLSWERET